MKLSDSNNLQSALQAPPRRLSDGCRRIKRGCSGPDVAACDAKSQGRGSIGSLSEPYSAVRMRLGTFSVLFLSLHGLGWLAKLRNWLHFKSMHVLHRFAEARAFNYCKSRLILSTATFIVWTPCSCCQSEQTMMHPYAFRNMTMGLFVVFGNT